MSSTEPTRTMLRAKIHRAVVTDANLEYEGSLTIPPELMELSDIREYEGIHVWNVTRGTRFETYAITGVRGSGRICVNGAAAHLAGPGDRVIIASFSSVPESLVEKFRPTVVFVDEKNAPIRTAVEVPGPHVRGNGC
ncbi:MAG TPA: aspartate 1-decarboxylase [Bacteroidota bacterium]|nr:aspartate 1-decarboxylase [Bacteroidota bacterium]